MTRKHSSGLVLSIICAFAMLTTDPAGKRTAHANPADKQSGPLAGHCLAIPTLDVFVPYRGGSFGVTISPVLPTIVRFPKWVDFGNSLTSYGPLDVSYLKNTAVIQPREQLPADLKTNVHLITDKVEATMNVSVARPATVMTSLVMVTPLPNKDFATRKAEAEAEQLERDAAKRLVYRKQVAALLLELKQLLNESPRVAALGESGGSPGKRTYAREGDTVAVQTWAVSVQGERYLKVTIDNQTSSQIELESAWIAESPIYGARAEFVTERGARTADDRIAVIPAYDQLTGMLLIPESVKSPLHALQVRFLGPAGLPTIVAKQIVELYPMPEEERRRRRIASQVSFSVRGFAGGFWLGDAAGAGLMMGTSMGGLAVRVSKGMHHNFAFEGEFVGGRSSDAIFRNVSWDTMEGDISRRASFGRAQASGVIRFGTKYVVSTRLGFGIQATSYDSTFTSGSDSMSGPGDAFELDGLWLGGVSFDARLNERWTLGTGVTFVGGIYTDNRSLEAGIRVSYGWNVGRNPWK